MRTYHVTYTEGPVIHFGSLIVCKALVDRCQLLLPQLRTKRSPPDVAELHPPGFLSIGCSGLEQLIKNIWTATCPSLHYADPIMLQLSPRLNLYVLTSPLNHIGLCTVGGGVERTHRKVSLDGDILEQLRSFPRFSFKIAKTKQPCLSVFLLTSHKR